MTANNPKYLNIARPYALAAFEYARENKALDQWQAFFTQNAMIAKDPSMLTLLANPEFTSNKAFSLFESLQSEQVDASQKNFLHLLAQNQRLSILPEISDLFNQYLAVLEKISKVKIETAVDLEDRYKQELIKALSRRIERDVTLTCEVRPEIIGGAIIHIGDKVIDGSIRGKLNRLLHTLTG